MQTLFEHDRDLGWWRSEVSPHMIVRLRENPEWVTVWDLRTMRQWSIKRGEEAIWDEDAEAARVVSVEYFDAHPAVPSVFEGGECWLIATPLHTGLVLVNSRGRFVYENGVIIDPQTLDITSAMKIYPQEEN